MGVSKPFIVEGPHEKKGRQPKAVPLAQNFNDNVEKQDKVSEIADKTSKASKLDAKKASKIASKSTGKTGDKTSNEPASKTSNVKRATKPKKTPASPTQVILTNISAIQTIISRYAVFTKNGRKNKIINIEEDTGNSIPQTIIASDELGAENDIPVSELLHERSKRSFYFLDSRKLKNKFWGIMIDHTMDGPLPDNIKRPCWWCRHTFTTRPIGCPLKYNAHKTTGIEKERVEEKFREAGLPTSPNDFFETEGCFCSFPCTKAYILDQKGSVKYKESTTLLTLLFNILYGPKLDILANEKEAKDGNFPVAPTWKILKEYGGHLTIEEYRSSFGKLEYDLTVNTKRPYMYCSSGYISEKKIKLFKGAKEI